MDISPVYSSDLWTLRLQDLGFQRAGAELVSMAAHGTPPFAVGVFGKWGSGKTSLLRYCMARLGGKRVSAFRPVEADPAKALPEHAEGDWDSLKVPAEGEDGIAHIDSIRCIWFNPWQYQNEPNPLVPLLHEIRSQMGFWLRVARSAGKTVNVAVESGIELMGSLIDAAAQLNLGSSFGFSKVLGGVREKGERWEKKHLETPIDSQRFGLLFESAVSRLLSGEKEIDESNGMARLVIFVDDLDRCEDERILHLLESMKLYLSSRHCVFVLGLDPGAVVRALRRTGGDKSAMEVREYLEKLFQGVIHVPICRDYTLFVAGQLQSRRLPHESRYPVIKGGIADLICRVVEPNPRKVKNFLNTLQASWSAIEPETKEREEFDFAHLVLLTYLKQYHPDVARTIEYDVDNIGRLADVFMDWRGALPKFRHMAAFYARSFRHVLDVGAMENVGAMPVSGFTVSSVTTEAPAEDRESFLEDLESTPGGAAGDVGASRIGREEYAGLVDRGYDYINRTLDRHQGDQQFASLFNDIFGDVIQKRGYLAALIRPAVSCSP